MSYHDIDHDLIGLLIIIFIALVEVTKNSGWLPS